MLLAVQTELAEIDTGKSEATTVEHSYIAARLPQEDFRFLTGGKGISRQLSLGRTAALRQNVRSTFRYAGFSAPIF